MDYISTTSLASDLDMSAGDLFTLLKGFGWIERKGEKWQLTALGKSKGGQTRSNPKFGEYIVWPEDIDIDGPKVTGKQKFLNATAIGKHFNVSSQRLNLILSELGWIQKDLAGWEITMLGEKIGGIQFEHETSGSQYVRWPADILSNKNLVAAFQDHSDHPATEQKTGPNSALSSTQPDGFREKFEAKYRTKDGHYVRSRAEVLICNALYEFGLAHAYERKLPVEEDLYSDFYLPDKKVYIEYWGMEQDPKYKDRKSQKLGIYKKYGLNLIELTDDDIANLDDFLPRKLLQFGIKVF